VKLYGQPFNDLLPTSVKDDPKFVAAAAVLDAMLADTDANVDLVRIWDRLANDEIDDENLLDNLAWQLHLEGYEGYPLATTIEQKRELVKNAILLHLHKGTRWSLDRIFEILGVPGHITEWWEAQDPPDPTFKPYEFDIDFDVPPDQQLDGAFYDTLYATVEALKNVRSHRRMVSVMLKIEGEIPKFASTAQVGHTISIYPVGGYYSVTCAVYIAAGQYVFTELDIYPFTSFVHTEKLPIVSMTNATAWTVLADPLTYITANRGEGIGYGETGATFETMPNDPWNVPVGSGVSEIVSDIYDAGAPLDAQWITTAMLTGDAQTILELSDDAVTWTQYAGGTASRVAQFARIRITSADAFTLTGNLVLKVIEFGEG
jgi:phage tail P2-like protein